MDNSPFGMALSAWFAQRTPGEESCRLPIGVHTKHAMRGWRHCFAYVGPVAYCVHSRRWGLGWLFAVFGG